MEITGTPFIITQLLHLERLVREDKIVKSNFLYCFSISKIKSFKITLLYIKVTLSIKVLFVLLNPFSTKQI